MDETREERILYCNCTYARAVPEEVKSEVLAGLVGKGVAFDAVPDLCELAAKGDPSLARLTGGPRRVKIAACYPRAVRWLFHRAGVPFDEDRVEVYNMRTESGEDILHGLLANGDTQGETA